MYSFRLLLFLSVFLVIEAETSPMEEDSILKQRDAPIDSIKALAEYIEKALTYEYETACLYKSCQNLEKTPASCATIKNSNGAELDALSPGLIKCAAEGACDVKKFVQPLKPTNIPLAGESDKRKCYFTSNPGKLILSGIKQKAKALEAEIYNIHVTGILILADFKLECSNLSPIPFLFMIKLDFTYRFSNGVEDGLIEKSLDFSAIAEMKYAHMITKVIDVFKKYDQLSKSICGPLSKLLASLYTGFYMRKCEE